MAERAGNEDPSALFRRAVIASPALQTRLGAIKMPDLFEAESAAVAAELGIIPPSGTRAGDDGHDPDGLRQGPVELDRWPGIGWLPARSIPAGGAPAFDWAWFGDHALTEPFYEDAVRSMAARPFSRAFRTRTTLDALIAGAAAEATLAPQGLIFHMSRCGSTLAAQMLAAVPDHVVISEAGPIDAVVQWAAASGAPIEIQITALRAIVAAFGRNRSGSARRLFLKLDAWHVLALPLFRAAFPDVPWVFLYREPEEVMVSQVRMPGMHFAAGGMLPAELGVDPAGAFSIEEHGASVLAQLLRAAAAHHPSGGGMLVDYTDLPAAMDAAIPAHFGFVPDADERAAMTAAKSRDAKSPDARFKADSRSKRAAVTPAIAAAVARHLRAPYAELEALRAAEARISRNLHI